MHMQKYNLIKGAGKNSELYKVNKGLTEQFDSCIHSNSTYRSFVIKDKSNAISNQSVIKSNYFNKLIKKSNQINLVEEPGQNLNKTKELAREIESKTIWRRKGQKPVEDETEASVCCWQFGQWRRKREDSEGNRRRGKEGKEERKRKKVREKKKERGRPLRFVWQLVALNLKISWMMKINRTEFARIINSKKEKITIRIKLAKIKYISEKLYKTKRFKFTNRLLWI